jgi:hypothetical protein
VSFAAREHEFEAEHGLPEPLPRNERLLWQGTPDWRALAVNAFHVRKLIVYFGVILLARGAAILSDGGTAAQAAIGVLWLAPLAVIAVAIAVSLAQLSARTAVYTITDRRVVMRVGIVLTVTFNLPFRSIQNADLRIDPHGGTGDIALALKAPDRIAYLHLWPHARRWRFARPEPTLRGVPDAAVVARILSSAWSQATGIAPAASDAQPAVLAH